jgi:Dihydrofolate reductase
MTISLIVAMSESRVIGRDNRMPWGRLSADLKRFKALTLGHHLIMGRKTYESVGEPLPGRTNVVVTRQKDFAPDGVVVARTIDEAIEACKGDPEIFVAGGAEIYRQTVDRADRIYLTIVHGEFEGDTRFPAFDPSRWKLVSREELPADEKNVAACSFLVYERA